MRSIRSLSFLSASLVALTLGGAASAAPGLITKRGPFPAEGAAEASSHPLLERAARKVVGDQLELSRGLSFGQAKVVELSRGDRVVKLRQLHKGLPVVHRGVAVTFSGGVARLVSARLESELPDDVTPDVSSELAAAVAEERTGLPVVSDQIALALWPTPDGVRLVWALGAAIPGMPYQPVTVVDAKTGEIIYVYNALVVAEPGAALSDQPGEVAGPDRRHAQPRRRDARKRPDQEPQLHRPEEPRFGLRVQRAHLRSAADGAPRRTNGDYLVAARRATPIRRTRSRRCRCFTTRIASYELFRSWSQPGFTVRASALLDRERTCACPRATTRSTPRTSVNPDCRSSRSRTRSSRRRTRSSPRCSGSTAAALWFGQGPVKDYSYDGDVVYHELSHAVVERDDQARGDAAPGRVRRS
jgi:hypothetical protein